VRFPMLDLCGIANANGSVRSWEESGGFDCIFSAIYMFPTSFDVDLAIVSIDSFLLVTLY
jgi:hypothetical protein